MIVTIIRRSRSKCDRFGGICRIVSDCIGVRNEDQSNGVNPSVSLGRITHTYGRNHDSFDYYKKIGLGVELSNLCNAPSRWQSTERNVSQGDKAYQSSKHVSSSVEMPWILRTVPSSWVPYMRLSRIEKPIGTWLLAWPCFWSLALAAPPGQFPDPKMLSLFGIGAVLLRGAGCTINDLWDQELDRNVERTRSRPIAARHVTSFQAGGWLVAQLMAGLGVLLQLNHFSQVLGASSLLLVSTYPLMKRFIDWPQAFLGMTINWGAILGWSAVHGSINWQIVAPLYVSGICWTLIYDTIYAHQDKKDDISIGIKSTALKFAEHSKTYFTVFAALNIVLLGSAGYAADCGMPFFLGLMGPATHLAWQIKTVDLNNPADCSKKFSSNTTYGALVFFAIIIDRLMAKSM